MNIGLNGLNSILLSIEGVGDVVPDFDCDASVNVGDPVVINSMVAYQCIPNSENNARWQAICIAKATSTVCTLKFGDGLGPKIYSGLTERNTYWVNKTGGVTNTPYDLDIDSGLWVVSPVGIALNDKQIIYFKGELKVL